MKTGKWMLVVNHPERGEVAEEAKEPLTLLTTRLKLTVRQAEVRLVKAYQDQEGIEIPATFTLFGGILMPPDKEEAQ